MKFTATYQGQTATRTSRRPYRFAAVVRWSDGRITVGAKWATTEKSARSCLTSQQKENGATVLAVVAVTEEEPDTQALSKSLGGLLGLP